MPNAVGDVCLTLAMAFMSRPRSCEAWCSSSPSNSCLRRSDDAPSDTRPPSDEAGRCVDVLGCRVADGAAEAARGW